MNCPFFSLVILGRGALHLLPLTIETIKSQKEKDFEVLFIAQSEAMLRLDPDVPIKIFSTKEQELAGMMNEGISHAKGRYIQFLQPGDYFLSEEGLSNLRDLIEEQNEPHLVYSGILMKNPKEPPYAIFYPFNRESLQSASFSSMLKATWFQRETLVKLGGFDKAFKNRTAFDLFCRLYKEKNLRIASSRRIITDADPLKASSFEKVKSFQETCQILYRYFGFKPMFRWVIGKR